MRKGLVATGLLCFFVLLIGGVQYVSAGISDRAGASGGAGIVNSDTLRVVQGRVFDESFFGQFTNLPYYSYGRGLGLITPDSTYSLNIRFRMQNRSTLFTEQSEYSFQGEVRRVRLRFDGFVGDPRFLYAIQLSFAPGDVGPTIPGDNLNIIRDAVFFYRANPRLTLGFGQTKLPGNRQRVNSSGALQLTDRSINNAVFTIDRDFGFFVNYSRETRDRFSYAIRAALSNGDGRNEYRNASMEAITARLELMPLGSFLNNGTLFEGDLAREPNPKLMMGGTFHINNARRTRGQLGAQLYERRQLISIHLDGMFKYRGTALMASWMARYADDAITLGPVSSVTGERLSNYVLAGTGYDLQASYLFHSNYEIIGRFSHLMPDSQIRNLEAERLQYTAGITRYIWEHQLKVQGEITFEQRKFPNFNPPDSIYFRFQIEIGI